MGIEKAKELIPVAREMTEKFIPKGLIAVFLSKPVINIGLDVDIHSGLLLEKLSQVIGFLTRIRQE